MEATEKKVWHKVFEYPEDETIPVWTARGIMDRQPDYTFRVGLLWDRQQMDGGTQEDRANLAEWLNTYGIEAMNDYVKENWIRPDGEDLIEITAYEGYVLKATPNKSYGYMYITAYPVETA